MNRLIWRGYITGRSVAGGEGEEYEYAVQKDKWSDQWRAYHNGMYLKPEHLFSSKEAAQGACGEHNDNV